MQHWRDQAEKNGLNIQEHGSCQLCGAQVDGGIAECVTMSDIVTHKLNHEDAVANMTIFLCTDAHALQHSEIHGRWNNHFHLARLHLILNKNIHWNYELSPKLSSVIDKYKTLHPDNRISAPEPKQRGAFTVFELGKTSDPKEYVDLVQRWATEVHETYASGHHTAEDISGLLAAEN